MLEVLLNYINCFFTNIVGFYVIKIIINSNKKIFDYKIILLIISSVINTFLQQNQYMGIHTLLIFVINIIVYKKIFEIRYNDSIITTGVSMVLMFISELIVTLIAIPIIPQQFIESNIIIRVILNAIIGILTILLIRIKYIKNKLQNFYKNIKVREYITNIIFFILIIITLAFFTFDIYKDFSFSYESISRLATITILLILTSILIKNRNQYSQLSLEYDNLFSYIQNFEDWIEKEQLNRHEYKNQLAVLRCLTTESNVKEKIDEILNDSIKLEGKVIQQLKSLPKGGIKGLMYYKSAIAQKNKINLSVDISIKRKSILNKLNEHQVKILCNLIGIYYDNAIDAALKTRKKNILIEIYEVKNKINIVISNTFKKSKNFENRNNKGVTTKGKGHGYGLYFAQKLISKNKWLEEKQEIIDNYYIQTITIKKLDTK